MPRSSRAKFLALCLLVLGGIAGCAVPGEPAPASADVKGESAKRTEPRIPEPLVASSGDVVLDLGEGPDLKSYLLRSKSLTCVNQDRAWRVRASDAGTTGLSEVHVLVYPPAGGASRFTIHATIGRLAERANRRVAVRVSGAEGSIGSGTGVTSDDGKEATLRAEGRTGEGMRFVLTVKCASVLRLPSRTGRAR